MTLPPRPPFVLKDGSISGALSKDVGPLSYDVERPLVSRGETPPILVPTHDRELIKRPIRLNIRCSDGSEVRYSYALPTYNYQLHAAAVLIDKHSGAEASLVWYVEGRTKFDGRFTQALVWNWRDELAGPLDSP